MAEIPVWSEMTRVCVCVMILVYMIFVCRIQVIVATRTNNHV